MELIDSIAVNLMAQEHLCKKVECLFFSCRYNGKCEGCVRKMGKEGGRSNKEG